MDESSQNKFDGQKQGTEFLRTSLPPAGAQIVSGPPLFLPPSISARSLISHFLPHIKLAESSSLASKALPSLRMNTSKR